MAFSSGQLIPNELWHPDSSATYTVMGDRASSSVSAPRQASAVAPAPTKPLPRPRSPQRIRFTTVDKLFDQIRRADGQIEVFTFEGVPLAAFEVILSEREKKAISFRVQDYLVDSGLLVVTVPTGPHEILHRFLNGGLYAGLVLQGLNLSWSDVGSKTYRSDAGSIDESPGGGKEGDSCGRPTGWSSRWPTIVIEAGYSQSMADLVRVVTRWFRISDHNVKIVILAKLEVSSNQIIVEKWMERDMQPGRQGATSTRSYSASRMEQVRDQRLVITRTGRDPMNLASYNVARGDLRLEFNHVFGRNPNVGERDIILDANFMQAYGRAVWEEYFEHIGGAP